MQRKVLFFLLIIAIVSCKNRAIIPEKDMVLIVAKIQILDASTQHFGYRSAFFNKDTIDNYTKIIQSFGYTKAQFDSSLNYYSGKPKEMDNIYDKVIIELSKVETKIKEIESNKRDSISRDSLKNLWPLKTKIDFPKDDSIGTVDFSIPVTGLGSYTISAKVFIFDDDKSLNTSMMAYFYLDDKSKEGNKSGMTTAKYLKGKDTLDYTITLDLNNTLVTHLKGSLYNYSNKKQNIKKHALITDIKVTYKQTPLKRVKLRAKKERSLK